MNKQPYKLESSTKTSIHKRNDMLQQIIKLTKENQYLITKVNCLSQQLYNITALKDKYKKKYKQLKSISTNLHIPKQTKINNSPTISKLTGKQLIQVQYSIEKADGKCERAGNDENKKIEMITASLSRIDDGITDLNKKICLINQYVQPLKYQEVWSRITSLGNSLNKIIWKFQNQFQFNCIDQYEASEYYGLEHHNAHIPIRQSKEIELRASPKLERFRFIQSKSQNSFENELLKYKKLTKEQMASQSEQEWKELKQVGKQLKNWRFSVSSIKRNSSIKRDKSEP